MEKQENVQSLLNNPNLEPNPDRLLPIREGWLRNLLQISKRIESRVEGRSAGDTEEMEILCYVTSTLTGYIGSLETLYPHLLNKESK